jgi:hypothetical protein
VIIYVYNLNLKTHDVFFILGNVQKLFFNLLLNKKINKICNNIQALKYMWAQALKYIFYISVYLFPRMRMKKSCTRHPKYDFLPFFCCLCRYLSARAYIRPSFISQFYSSGEFPFAVRIAFAFSPISEDVALHLLEPLICMPTSLHSLPSLFFTAALATAVFLFA